MLHRIYALLCIVVFALRAEYYCDEFKCSDYKLGLGGLAGTHHSSLHRLSIQAITLNALFSQYTSQYGFMWDIRVGAVSANVHSAQSKLYDKENFRTFGAHIDSTLFFAKNIKNDVHNPFFVGIVLGGSGFIFDEKYAVPNIALFTLGLGLSSSYLLQNNLAFEYGFSYHYGVYGLYSSFHSYTPDNFGYNANHSSLKPNNHQIRAFVGIHNNKAYGFYTKLHLSLTHLDAARNPVTNRLGVSSVYPSALQAFFGLECGYGFSKWL
ncbi:MAG: hypothetical protein J1E28_06065 [Helicobacter sp.]|uniref:hypothetical protein n=1 Tax=Helicobacter sp. TaxID=218 RepID=UPI0025BC059A|nr:hypothetical protein [Helicobacter sp.]MCH5313936.1 hypothetical protein [Helicobacter sp.]